MPEDLPENPGTEPEAEYEFKPFVKWIAIGVLVALVIGVEIGTYRLGVSHGFDKGQQEPSALTQAKSDAKAVLNLKHFLKCASADDATLRQLVANRKRELAWIQEKHLLREVEWMLGSTMIQRGKIAESRSLLDELFASVGSEPDRVWTHRIEMAADAESRQGSATRALKGYSSAASHYARLGLVGEELRCMNHQVELLTRLDDPHALVDALKKLYQRAGELGEAGRSLQVNTLAHLGRIFRAQGDIAGSNRYFELAVKEWKGEKNQQLASARICLGEALLESGRKEEAAKLIEQGVADCSAAGSEAEYLMSGLRSLARLAAERGDLDAALAFLYRAEGVAHANLPEHSPYWPCLFDQRGWVLLQKGVPELALADFTRAASSDAEPSAVAQSCEGIGRASIELGRAKEAVSSLEKALSLREEHFAGDFASKARVERLLGMACDMQNDTQGSIRAYRRALGDLARLGAGASPALKVDLLMGLGYAYSERHQWELARDCWEQVLPLLSEERRREIKVQLEDCKRAIAKLPPAAEPAEEE